MNSRTRLVTLAVVLVISYFAIRMLESGYKSAMVAPTTPLSDLPLTLSGWEGTDVPIDEEVDRVIDAHSNINRNYRAEDGSVVSLHVAAFTDPIYRASAPHHPEQCYTAAGWKIMEREVLEVGFNESSVSVGLTLFQRRGEHVVTAHWYSVGDQVFTGSEGMQSHFSKFWGSDSCPCIRKHLIQLPVSTVQEAKPILEDFVPKIVSEIQRLES